MPCLSSLSNSKMALLPPRELGGNQNNFHYIEDILDLPYNKIAQVPGVEIKHGRATELWSGGPMASNLKTFLEYSTL